MSIESCIARLLKQGKITDEEAKNAKRLYDGIYDAAGKLDETTRQAHAALTTAEILDKAAAQRKLELARRTQVYNANAARIAEHPNGPIAGFMGLYDRDIRNAAGDRLNVSSLEKEHYAPQIAAKMHEADEAYRSRAAGLKQDVSGVRSMVREVFGVATGDKIAADAAKGWQAATDFAVSTAKALGKVFDTDEEWRLPQFWDSKRVEKFGAKTLVDDINRHVDSGALNVFDPETGQFTAGVNRARVIDEAVRHIREDISRGAGSARSVFKQEIRVFRFEKGAAGADAYLEMMDKYGVGQGNYFSMMQGHAQSMARELALLHVMGPGFSATGDQLLKDAIAGEASRRVDLVDQFGKKRGRTLFERMGDGLLRGVGLEGVGAAKRMNDYMLGRLSGVEGQLANGIVGGARSFLTSANMGSAIVTAIPADSVNWAMAASFRGLKAGRLAEEIVTQLLGGAAHDKELMAAKLGIVSHAATRYALATKQFGDQMFGAGVFQRMADFVIRAQGLHAWDNAINRAFTMEFLASLAERQGKAFGELDKPFAAFLSDYGFTAADWAKLSAGPVMTAGPAKFLMPDALEAGIRAKLMSAIGDEKQFAFLAGGSNRVRALTTGGAKPGTFGGEASRSFFLFKQFPISMLATHGVRAAQEAASGKWGQAIQLAIFMTLAGAVALQAKQVLQGKDPQSMHEGWFWGEAALQGGALGIYGDFLKEGFSRSASSLVETAIGPLASIPTALQRLTSGARRAAENGEHVNFGSALADDIGRFTPGSNLWYSRLLFNRAIVDNVHRAIDPDYAGSFRRARDRAQKLHGQGFWWGPGSGSPDRAPDLGAALGGHP